MKAFYFIGVFKNNRYPLCKITKDIGLLLGTNKVRNVRVVIPSGYQLPPRSVASDIGSYSDEHGDGKRLA